MHFAHDTQVALAETAALVNTLSDGVDQLDTQAGLDAPFSEDRHRGDPPSRLRPDSDPRA